jgi:hypothetical protein
MLLPQIINEIKDLKDQPTHRSCMIIFGLLEKNRNRFLQNMDPDDYNSVHKLFERLSEASLNEYSSAQYRSDYDRAHNLLLFYLDRII